jgi:hypothetical protein
MPAVFICKKSNYFVIVFFTPLTAMPPAISVMTNRTRNMKNRIFAIPAAATAIPVNPNNAAIRAITRNVILHLSIIFIYLALIKSASFNFNSPYEIVNDAHF